MKRYTRDALDRALGASGLTTGDLVLVHTALYAPGRIVNTPLVEISSRLYSSLRRLIGRQGTIVVPTFFDAFRRGETFDRQFTPSTGTGSFSEYMRLLPDARRSPHALHSVAAEGPLAEAITGRDTPSAFGRGSPFDALIDYDARVLTYGCTLESTCMIRWAEERIGVPYRRWMICRGKYVDDGVETMRSFHTYAGENGREPHLCLKPVHHHLSEQNQIRRAPLGSSIIECCRVRDFATAACEILQRDPRALLESRSRDNQQRPQSR